MLINIIIFIVTVIVVFVLRERGGLACHVLKLCHDADGVCARLTWFILHFGFGSNTRASCVPLEQIPDRLPTPTATHQIYRSRKVKKTDGHSEVYQKPVCGAARDSAPEAVFVSVSAAHERTPHASTRTHHVLAAAEFIF